MENNKFRQKIDLLRDEAKLLKQQATDAGTNFEVLRQDAKKLAEELRKSLSTSAELRADAAQLRADAAQLRADAAQLRADRALSASQENSTGYRRCEREIEGNPIPYSSTHIFVLEPDNVVRPVLTQNLKDWGYELVIAVDEDDAFQHTQMERQAYFNLVLIDQFKQPVEKLKGIGQQICRSLGLNRPIPILIMAEDYGPELEGQTTYIGDNVYVCYLEDGEQLKALLQDLCSAS